MDIQYTWQCTEAEAHKNYNGLTDVVFLVDFRLVGKYENIEAERIGTAGLNLENVSEANFIALEQLNTDIVIEWVKDYLGNDYIDVMKEGIKEEIKNILNPTTKRISL